MEGVKNPEHVRQWRPIELFWVGLVREAYGLEGERARKSKDRHLGKLAERKDQRWYLEKWGVNWYGDGVLV
jgi:hypothetical protein